jgi:hypothetical protein
MLLSAFLTSTLDGDNWSASIQAALLPGRQIPVPTLEAVWTRQKKVSTPAWDQRANPQSHSPYISLGRLVLNQLVKIFTAFTEPSVSRSISKKAKHCI